MRSSLFLLVVSAAAASCAGTRDADGPCTPTTPGAATRARLAEDTPADSRSVTVTGAMQAVVPLPAEREMRILDLLRECGALDSEECDCSRVRIRLRGPHGEVFWGEVDVDRLFAEDDAWQDRVLMPGDVVWIPRRDASKPRPDGYVYVLGAVNERGRIPFVRGEQPFTMVRLVSICGDFSAGADRRQIRVIRATPDGRAEHTVDFDAILDGSRPDFELKPDDVVRVASLR